MSNCHCTSGRPGGPRCTPCSHGHHSFCNFYPHGDAEDAIAWFVDNPHVLADVHPLSLDGVLLQNEAARRVGSKALRCERSYRLCGTENEHPCDCASCQEWRR